MAWLDCPKTGIYQVGFTFGGKRFKRSLGTRDEKTVEASACRVEENIRLVATGHLSIPPNADVATFLISDGKLTTPNHVELPKELRLGELFGRYQESLPSGAVAPETLRIAEIHMRHISRITGLRRHLQTIERADLQHYVNVRTAETGERQKPVSPGTIKKELSTFRTLWRWAREAQYVKTDFPNRGLRYPRQVQKMPFMTWDQIELRIKRGLPEGHTEADYWDCLYLDRDQLEELLSDIESLCDYRFLYPMAAMAAHTGARRSELCRSMREDIDFESEAILIREKKREKGRDTFRHVPMCPKLQEVLSQWLTHAPVSAYSFPPEHRVSRIRNRNRRENDYHSVASDEATDHLDQTLSGTRWERIRGWHIFRHSFISNCASLGVEQRMIDAWVGHQTEEMRKRYMHLLPNRQKLELQKVFG